MSKVVKTRVFFKLELKLCVIRSTRFLPRRRCTYEMVSSTMIIALRVRGFGDLQQLAKETMSSHHIYIYMKTYYFENVTIQRFQKT
jgi:hypothetical protein